MSIMEGHSSRVQWPLQRLSTSRGGLKDCFKTTEDQREGLLRSFARTAWFISLRLALKELGWKQWLGEPCHSCGVKCIERDVWGFQIALQAIARSWSIHRQIRDVTSEWQIEHQDWILIVPVFCPPIILETTEELLQFLHTIPFRKDCSGVKILSWCFPRGSSG